VAAGPDSTGAAIGIGRCGRGHSRAARFASFAGHQRIGAAANRNRAHQQQRDMAGALHRRGRWDRSRSPSAEFLGWFHRHGQVIIEAAAKAPAASEDSPSQIAAPSSPAAIFADRFGTGILTMK
jgi:hypothetical protein